MSEDGRHLNGRKAWAEDDTAKLLKRLRAEPCRCDKGSSENAADEAIMQRAARLFVSPDQ